MTGNDGLPAQDVLQDHRFPCTTCGADMRFSPDTGALACDHCGATETLDIGGATGPYELDYSRAIKDLLPQQDMEDTRVSECPNCGAQVEFSAEIHATECPFCATPVVTDTGLHRQIKPRGLLPFALSEATARDAMNDWLGGLWFAPNGLQNYARKGRKLSGIYVPYWTFDADTKSQYSGMRGDDYYVTKTVMRDGKRKQVRERRTKWRNKSGRVARFFDDVLVLASTSLPKKYTEGLEPWDLQAMEPYVPDYIAGFRAESYSVDLEDGYRSARSYMDRVILRDVKFDIGGDRQQVASVNTQVSNVTFKHVLLPVWMAAYKYRGKTYRFVVNGRTGRVQGERPWSAWKIAFAVILGAIVAGAIGFIASQYQ
ncbi:MULTISPECIES: primosomal protein N' (replication factor Y) - superfamily II helicase [Pacificibacter]|uniref:primosomal protein N' (replication factor Y) - superfamily II helicase n=1 Tax=Pacificibacter TaxID=1042323 RepID=UPI001C0807DA|nr:MULTISPECIES: primosomal protein N' (replication factor Y) - superfamily II helicase [Pacificibacter]MBU2937509.1 primosomal protein N' (replication factor Y) - superfamily II helicase [Pacificibacter marinus]MDO6615689.1 primosomal protein N' (replication factor Y) - superfamily II helicase [Pacificibacter sp. 1_MG-2023]